MTGESILLVGRETRDAGAVLGAHARRLRERGVVDEVAVATYEEEPVRELRSQFAAVDAETVYAVPMCAAHSHDTLDGVAGALSYVDGEVHYCDPVGGAPAVTDVIAARGAEAAAPAPDVSLVLVAFGSSSKPHHRRTADYHAERLRERTDYGEVVTCYLLQNPAVECVRYALSNEQAVAVPLFCTRTAATEQRVPAELELERGGIDYADPLGDHPRVTDAVQTAVEARRDSGDDADSEPRVADAAGDAHAVATDGDGRPGQFGDDR